MSEVISRDTVRALECARPLGVDPQAVRDSVRGSEALDTRPRISWELCASLVNELERRLGEDADKKLRQIGRLMVTTTPYARFFHMFALAADARLLYRALNRWAGPHAFPMVRNRLDELPDGVLRLELSVPSSLPECRGFFLITSGVLQALPTIIGLPESGVDAEVTPHRAVLRIHPPPSRTLGRRIAWAWKALVTPAEIVEEMGRYYDQVRHGYHEMKTLERGVLSLLEAFPDGVCLCRDARIIRANGAMTRLLGHASPGDLGGRSLLEFVAAPAREALASRLDPSPSAAVEGLSEFSFLSADGRAVLLELSVQRGVTFEEEPAVLVVARDVTERRKAERALSEQQKLAALGLMATEIAHEIKNPLTVLHGSASMLLRKHAREGAPREREFLERIVDHADRMKKIIAGLSRFAHAEGEAAPIRVDLHTVVNDAIELCAANLMRHHVRLENTCEAGRFFASGQPVELCQVVVNLVQNAIDAIAEADERWIRVEAWAEDDSISLAVVDSGAGLPPEVRRKLFQPFFTTKEPGRGTGLGLSVSRRLVEQQGGELIYDQEHPHTRFVIELPAAHEQQPG